MISNNKDYSIDYLRSLLLDPTAFGILLEQYLYGQIKIFTNNVNGTSLQTKSKYLKIAISIDLFDNDLDKFINTFILPVIEIEENWNNIQDKIVMMS
jgi:hypothetical protein